MKRILLTLTLLLMISILPTYSQTWQSATIDTAISTTVSNAFYLDGGQDEHLVALSLDTALVGTEFSFQGYDWVNADWREIRDYDGTLITVTPGTTADNIVGIKPIWAFFLTDSLKIVSNDTEVAVMTIPYKKGRIE